MAIPFVLENVFYINLEERTDRRESVEKQLNELGWKYKRFNAIKNKQKGSIGCSFSHLAVLKIAREKNLPYVVVIEDDIEFTNIPKFQKIYKKFVDSGVDFDVYLLAGNLRRGNIKINNSLTKVRSSFTTTGYIVKNAYYDKLIDNIKLGLQYLLRNLKNPYYTIDAFWMRLQKQDNWYISRPRTVTQLKDFSDIEKKLTNYDKVMLDT